FALTLIFVLKLPYHFKMHDLAGYTPGADGHLGYIAWLAGEVPVHAMEMPGSRYDIGNLESYEKVQKEYGGIVR
ncbi:MAG: hypothetical protein IIX15_00905, partial [Clostridia bacterium]|nr:hypothetical protein [Clostridia bacterium]